MRVASGSLFLASGRAILPAAANAKLSNLIHGREGINFSGLNKPAPMVVQPLPTHMSRATILHVEDDPNDALLFQHACRKAGMDVNLRVVDDGEQAQAYLKGEDQFQNRDEHPFPTLVVLDLKLSFVNGFEVLEWMRKETKLRRVPVIVLSSSNRPADVKRAYDLGANSFLVKPVAFEGLLNLVKGIQQYWLTLNRGA